MMGAVYTAQMNGNAFLEILAKLTPTFYQRTTYREKNQGANYMYQSIQSR